ncbi:MAG: DUF885 domain-containing protein [Chitinophagales bacterium]|nr:DUF885 domain-containing protein [Chitinophagales bacterium]
MIKSFYSALLLILLVSLSSCQQSKKGNSEFESFKLRMVDDMWKQYPNWAKGVGYHKYDSVLPIPDEANRKSDLAFAARYLDSLKDFIYDSLSPMNKTDYLLIKNMLEGTDYAINEYKSYTWDASQYNFGGTLFEITQNKEDSNAIIGNLDKFLAKTPAYFEAAKRNLTEPTLEHTSLAIQQLTGTIDMLQYGEIREFYNRKNADTTFLGIASKAIQGFISHLENLKSEMESGKRKAKSFRLGKKLYEKKFNLDIASSFSSDEMFQIASQRKESLQTEMFAIATRLWDKYLPNTPLEADSLKRIKMVIDKVALQHVKREDFQREIERQIPILNQFIVEKDLVTMDASKPLVVRKEPAWMAGVAGASISSPGPYAKNANTYYNVGSLAFYSPEAAESFLREYNQFTLQILNIHEAIPGHYVQLIHANKSPSIIQNLLQNGAFIEGWALYAERLMMEEGWDKNTSINQTEMSDEMWLMYYKFHLRGVCNTILDISIHTKEMTEEQAMHLMQVEAFQEKSEAEGKWRRAKLTQVQLCSYFTGFNEIYTFREEVKKQMGAQFNLKAFNDRLLSFGAPPMKYVKEMFGRL